MEDNAACEPLLLDERAIELCVRKVANFQGDCRQALDACRRALCMKADSIRAAEAAARAVRELTLEGESPCAAKVMPPKKQRGDGDTRGSPSTPTTNCTTPSPESVGGGLESEKLPRPVTAGLMDVATVLERQFKSDKAMASEALSKMPLHQQLVLYSACRAAPMGASGELVLKEYRACCAQRGLSAASKSTVLDALEALESSGMIALEAARSKSKNVFGGTTTPNVRLKLSANQISSMIKTLAPMAFGTTSGEYTDA
eukprot:Filipodium_phascolosomae@DN332_c0_g1_i1.p1